MSADNYGIIHRHGDGWGLSDISESDDRDPDLRYPMFTAATADEVCEYAETRYFEYGYTIAGDDGPQYTPSGVWYCRVHSGITDEDQPHGEGDPCDWGDRPSDGSCDWVELVIPPEVTR